MKQKDENENKNENLGSFLASIDGCNYSYVIADKVITVYIEPKPVDKS
jgi:hypothetical protein